MSLPRNVEILLITLASWNVAAFGIVPEANIAALAADDVCAMTGTPGCALSALQRSKGANEPRTPAAQALSQQAQIPGLDNIMEKVTEAVSDAASNATDLLKGVVDQANGPLNVTSIVSDAASKVQDSIANATGKAIEATGMVKDLANDLGVELPPEVKDLDLEKVNEQAGEIASQAVDAVRKAEAESPEVKKEILHGLSSMNQTAQEKIQEAHGAVQKAEEDAVAKINDTLKHLPSDVTKEVEKVVNGITTSYNEEVTKVRSSGQRAVPLGLLALAFRF